MVRDDADSPLLKKNFWLKCPALGSLSVRDKRSAAPSEILA
jgi:hypothetical protein